MSNVLLAYEVSFQMHFYMLIQPILTHSLTNPIAYQGWQNTFNNSILNIQSHEGISRSIQLSTFKSQASSKFIN